MRAAIDLSNGQWTNVPAYSLTPDKSSSVINYLITETGAGVSRPGTATFVTPSASVVTVNGDTRVTGLFSFLDYLVAVDANRRVYAIKSDATQADITGATPLPGTSVPGFFNDNGKLLIYGGGAPLAWDGGITPCALFAPNVSMPSPTSMVMLNRYLLANNIYRDLINFSDPVDHASWSLATQFFTAESRNDPVIALGATFGELYAFGPETIDIYYFAASDTAGPFSLAWTIQRGLGAERGLASVDNTFYFIDSERKIIVLEARTPKVISLQIEKQLQAMTRVDDCVLHRVEFEGKHILAFVFPTAKTTLVYDYVLGHWTEWREYDPANGWQPMSMLAYAYQPKWGKHFCSDFTSASIYELSSSYQDDHGNIRRCERETAPITHGTHALKESTCFKLRCLRGTATSNTSTSEAYRPEVWLSWRDDNRGWSGPIRRSLGRMGDSDMYSAEWPRMGQYRARQYRITMSDPVDFALISAEEDFSVIE